MVSLIMRQRIAKPTPFWVSFINEATSSCPGPAIFASRKDLRARRTPPALSPHPEFNDNLNTSNWNALTHTTTKLDTLIPSNRFYRVRLLPLRRTLGIF
jgi:hypothetical protein